MYHVTFSSLNIDNTGKHFARAFAAEARHRFHTCIYVGISVCFACVHVCVGTCVHVHMYKRVHAKEALGKLFFSLLLAKIWTQFICKKTSRGLPW